MPSHHGNVRHMFVLGLSTNSLENQRIFNEALHFGDILILNFTDTYRNLTLKTMSAMKWIALNCDRVKLIMKTDCDIFINIQKVAQFLTQQDYLSLPNTLLGQCYTGSIVNRDSSHKYYVSVEEYSFRYYPSYCSGQGYVMSLNTLRNLVRMSYFIPKIRMEDAYLGCSSCLKVKINSVSNLHFEFQDIADKVKKPEDLFSFTMVHGVPLATLRHLRHSWFVRVNVEKPWEDGINIQYYYCSL